MPTSRSFQQIDARPAQGISLARKGSDLPDGLKPAIDHRFDLGHGLVFESPRFGHGSVGQHEHRIVGFPVLDEINIYYEISASKPLTLEVASGECGQSRKRRSTTPDCSTRAAASRTPAERCASARFRCRPRSRRAVSFHADYQTGIVTVALVNVDRFDRVTLEFHSNAIEEPVLEDLVRLILGRDSAFLRRAPLAGLHGRPSAAV